MDTEKLSKFELLPMLVDAAIKYVSRAGADEHVEGLTGTAKVATADRLLIALRTPKALAHGESIYGVDAWYDNKKVLSVCWNSNTLKDFEIVRFKRGPWVPYLLGMAA